jgi:hypothetical protein
LWVASDLWTITEPPSADERKADVQSPKVMHGNGRDGLSVRAMRNLVVAGIVFQHPSIESLLCVLARNLRLHVPFGFVPCRCSVSPRRGCSPIPTRAVTHTSSWNVSRFLANVIEMGETLVVLRERQVALLPSAGRHLG